MLPGSIVVLLQIIRAILRTPRSIVHLASVGDDSAWVVDVEHQHDQEHHGCIEDVQEVLIFEQDAIGSHRVLGDSEHGTDEYQGTGDVQDVEVALPWDSELLGSDGWRVDDASVEDEGHDNEENEEEDLDSETASDDVLAKIDIFLLLGLRKHTSTTGLGEEGDHIADNEDCCEPL